MRDDTPLRFEVWIERYGPREILGVVEAAPTVRDKQLGDLFGVQIFLDGDVWNRADSADFGQHADILDQLAGLLNRFRCTVGIVKLRKADLAAIDAALFVDHLEIADDGTSCSGTKS